MDLSRISPKRAIVNFDTESQQVDDWIKETELLLQTATHYLNKGHIKDAVMILQRVHDNLVYLATVHDIYFNSN